MRQEDYLLREIQKISQLLLGIIGKVVRRKKDSIEDIESDLTGELNEISNNLSAILEMNTDEIVNYTQTQPALNTENLEHISVLFYELGVHAKNDGEFLKARSYFLKSIELNKYLDEDTSTFSFIRKSRTDEALQLIVELDNSTTK